MFIVQATNGKLTKWQVDKMASWQNGLAPKGKSWSEHFELKTSKKKKNYQKMLLYFKLVYQKKLFKNKHFIDIILNKF